MFKHDEHGKDEDFFLFLASLHTEQLNDESIMILLLSNKPFFYSVIQNNKIWMP